MSAASVSYPASLVAPVKEVMTATPSTRVVRLDLAGRPFAYEAGQAAMIGVADRAERVPYSIASAPAETARSGTIDFLIKVEPSGRWGHQFDRIATGMDIAVDGPFGTFVLPPAVREGHFLFIAGGTGIAPIRAMIRQLLLTGWSGSMKLLYSAKTADDFAYLPELGDIAAGNALELRLYVTRAADEVTASRAPAFSKTERGRLRLAHLAPLVDSPATLCFVCGPETMVADVPLMLEQLGVDRARIRVEEW